MYSRAKKFSTLIIRLIKINPVLFSFSFVTKNEVKVINSICQTILISDLKCNTTDFNIKLFIEKMLILVSMPEKITVKKLKKGKN